MRTFKNLVIGGIQTKVFNLLLVTVLLMSVAFMGVAQRQISMISELSAETNVRQQESMEEITSGVMDTVVEMNMDLITGIEAQVADDMFRSLQNRVEMLGDYCRKLFADQESVERLAYEGPDSARDGEVVAQLILADGVNEEEIADSLGVAANMSDMMVSLFGASEETNSCFVGLPNGAFLVTDDRSGSKFDENGNLISYDCRTRPWYQQAVEKGGLVFTDVEVDAFTGDIGIVCAMPVYVGDELVAVVGSDLFLTSMQETVQTSTENGGFLCVINDRGHVVFTPDQEGIFQVIQGSNAQNLTESENAELASLVSDALKDKTDVRLVTIGNTVYYMTGAPVKTVGWALVSGYEQELTDAPVISLKENYQQISQEAAETFYEKIKRLRYSLMTIILIIMALMLSGSLILGKRIVRPLNTITKRISSLSAGNLEFMMEDTYRTGDEIEVLADSFAKLSHKTVQYVEQVKSVTAEKERISTELHMANQIQESMLPSIFPAFPERPEFDVFATMNAAREVGGDFFDFFLIDEDHLCLVIADVSGKGIPAALFMMISKIILQSCAMLGRSAGEILTKTNEALCSNNRMEMFVTVWLGILEISTGHLTAANAGHEYPAVMKARDGRFELFKDRHGLVIGAIDGLKYKEYELQLEPGDKIFVYTDGVTEATNAQEELFGTRRMIEALNSAPEKEPQDILLAVHGAVDDFVGDAEQFDDLTMLCLEYKGSEFIDEGAGI